MARAAGIGVAAGVSTSAALASLLVPSVASHSLDGSVQRAQLRPLHLRFLLSANCCLSRQRMSKLQSFAPSGLYSPSDSPAYLNSALSRTSGPLQLGLSFSQGSARPEINRQVCGAARGMAAGSGSDLELWIKKKNSSEPVVVYSKTYCPYVLSMLYPPNSMHAGVNYSLLDSLIFIANDSSHWYIFSYYNSILHFRGRDWFCKNVYREVYE